MASKTSKTALLIPGGGYRVSYTSGLTHALVKYIDFSRIDGIPTFSAGIIPSKQIILNEKTNLWEKELIDPEAVSWSNKRKKGQFGDSEYVVSSAFTDANIEDLRKSKTKMIVSAFSVDRRETDYFDFTDPKYDFNFLRNVLKATGSLPGISDPVELNGNGEKYLDGGLEDIFPLDKIRERGYERILVLSNKHTIKKTNIEILARAFFPRDKKSREGYIESRRNYNDTIDLLDDDPNVLIIRPSEEVPVGILTMTKRKKKVNNSYALGNKDGNNPEYIERITEFLNES